MRACLAAVRRAGVALMVGFNRRFDPHFASLKQRLDAGEIGALELLTIISRDPSPPPPAYVAPSGGLFRDMMIHDLDMARFLLGEEPVEVLPRRPAWSIPAIGAAGDVDTALVMLRTAERQIVPDLQLAARGLRLRSTDRGARRHGMLRAGNVVPTTIEVATAAGFVTDPVLPFFLERYAAAYRAELDAFVKAATRRRPAAGWRRRLAGVAAGGCRGRRRRVTGRAVAGRSERCVSDW